METHKENQFAESSVFVTFMLQPEEVRTVEAAIEDLEESMTKLLKDKSGIGFNPVFQIQVQMHRVNVPAPLPEGVDPNDLYDPDNP